VWGDAVFGDEVPQNGLCQFDVGTSESILLSESLCSTTEDYLVSEIVSLGYESRGLLGQVLAEFRSCSGIEKWVMAAFKDCFVMNRFWHRLVSRLRRFWNAAGAVQNDSTIISLVPDRFLSRGSKGYSFSYRGNRNGFGCMDLRRRCDGRGGAGAVAQ
jgi:hypothetical protein